LGRRSEELVEEENHLKKPEVGGNFGPIKGEGFLGKKCGSSYWTNF
jgi:hypothetical protein